MILALLIAAAVSVPAPAPDTIDVRFTFDYAERHEKSVGDGTIRFESRRSGDVRATLDRYRAYAGVDSFQLTRPAAGSIGVEDSIVGSVGGGSAIQKERGSGPPSPEDTTITLHLDPNRGVYSFMITLQTKTTTEVSGPFGSETGPNAAGFEWSSPEYPIPSGSGTIRGEARVNPEIGDAALGTNFVPLGRVLKSTDGAALEPVRVTWEIGSPPPKAPLELVVSIDGYATWLPEDGNALVVAATLRRTDGGTLDTGAGMIRFELRDTSAETGTCLNQPKDATPDPKAFDLEFLDGADATPAGPDAQQAVTPVGKVWTRATARIGSFDWGGSAVLVVTAVVPDQGELRGKLDLGGASEILLPKRDPNSKVGDAWKERMKAVGLADDDDGEKSDGNANDGDGFTLYEEYRGVIARGVHSRRGVEAELDPKRKDLVVLAGETPPSMPGLTLRPLAGAALASARAGFRLFENAARRAHVVEMKQTEAPDSRRINANSRTAHAQHGVLVFDVASSEDGASGSTFPLEQRRKTPGTTTLVAIDFAGIAAAWEQQSAAMRAAGERMPFSAAEDATNTVAHELGHACGVSHHGDTEMESPLRELGPQHASPRVRVLDVDGAEIEQRPFTIRGTIGRGYSRASGDVRCLMTYNNAYSWSLKQDGGPVYRAQRPTKPGTTFCTGSDGDPANAEFGPADYGRGNCLSQIRMKDGPPSIP